MATKEQAAETATPRVMRVAIIGSPDKPAAAETLERARVWVAGRAELVFSAITYDSEQALAAEPDLLMVLGGDGTLIAAVHGLLQRQIPIVGINLGKLGYLADFTIEELEREGDFLFSGPLPVTRRTMMQVRLEPRDGRSHCTPAVNDCVVLAGPPFHMIQIVVEVDGDEVAVVRGDGLIVSTASGSTAHNLAAGGPIVEPTGEAFILTPICPHTLTHRPIVLSAADELRVSVQGGRSGPQLLSLSLDGQENFNLEPGDTVVVRRHPKCFEMLAPRGFAYFDVLRRKLSWGER